MNDSVLAAYRAGLYPCFQSAGAALMNAADALLTDPAARSFVELSLSPCFVRGWPSLYEGFEDGRIDRTAFRRLQSDYAPLSLVNRPILGIDASSIYRALAETSKDRTAQYVHNLPGVKAPVKPGWSFSTLTILPQEPSSWTYLLDNQRIESGQTAAEVAGAQLKVIVPQVAKRLPEGLRPLLLGDRYYGSAVFVNQVRALPIDGLFRLQGHRTFYRAAPHRLPKGQNPKGPPRKDGTKFQCKDPSTHDSPDAYWQGKDAKGRWIQVTAWNGLHFKECRETTLCVIQVTRHSALGTKRDPKISWFVAVGTPPPLSEVAQTYCLRFSQEHGYKFDKGDLLWNVPHLRTPEQFQRWTDVVVAVHNQLVLARPMAEVLLRPWESTQRPATPRQVRRAMGRLIAQLGTPAPAPQLRGKSPGRSNGATVKRAERFPVIKKTPKKPKSARPATSKAAKQSPAAATLTSQDSSLSRPLLC